MHILQHLTIWGLLVAASRAEDLLTHAQGPLEVETSTSNSFSVFGIDGSEASTMPPATSLFDGFRTKLYVDESSIRSVDEPFAIAPATAADATVSTTATATASAQELPGEGTTTASTTPTAAGEPKTSGSTGESAPSPIGSQTPAVLTDATTMKCTKHLIGHRADDVQKASPLTSSGCCQHQKQSLARASSLLQLLLIYAFYGVFY